MGFVMRILRRRTIAFAILANYLGLLTAGQALHDCGCANRDDLSGPVSGSHCACCSNLQDGSRSEDHRPAADEADAATDATAADRQPCLMCRFLAQKPMRTSVVHCVVSAPLTDSVETPASAQWSHPPFCHYNVRGPPHSA
jgi:hypothetical protein